MGCGSHLTLATNVCVLVRFRRCGLGNKQYVFLWNGQVSICGNGWQGTSNENIASWMNHLYHASKLLARGLDEHRTHKVLLVFRRLLFKLGEWGKANLLILSRIARLIITKIDRCSTMTSRITQSEFRIFSMESGQWYSYASLKTHTPTERSVTD